MPRRHEPRRRLHAAAAHLLGERQEHARAAVHRPGGDERALAALALDEAGESELLHRLAHGHPADVEAGAQVRLGRQPVSRRGDVDQPAQVRLDRRGSGALFVDVPTAATVRCRSCLDKVSVADGSTRRASCSTVVEHAGGGHRRSGGAVRRRDRQRRPRPSVRHRAQPHPRRGDVPALRLVPGVPPDRRAVDDVPHPGRRRQRAAAGDVHRARRGPRRGDPVQLQARRRPT